MNRDILICRNPIVAKKRKLNPNRFQKQDESSLFTFDPIRLFYVNLDMPSDAPLEETLRQSVIVEQKVRELLEPEEGTFDFTLVDGLINDARSHNLRLVFLWFGSWKNTFSSYVPGWVKEDIERFPRVMRSSGEGTERLSP